jgi:hypothetical protein
MADNNLVKVVKEVKAVANDLNQLFDALTGDIMPRALSGVVTHLGGSIGSIAFRWKNFYSEKITMTDDSSNILEIESDGVNSLMKVNSTTIVSMSENGVLPRPVRTKVTNNADLSNGEILFVTNLLISSTFYQNFDYTITTSGGLVAIGLDYDYVSDGGSGDNQNRANVFILGQNTQNPEYGRGVYWLPAGSYTVRARGRKVNTNYVIRRVTAYEIRSDI